MPTCELFARYTPPKRFGLRFFTAKPVTANGARDDEVLIKESPLQQGETGAAEPPPLDLASGAAAGGAAASSAALPRFDPAAAAEPGGNGRAVSGLLDAVVAEIRSGPMRAASVPPASPAASPFVFVAESPLL